MTLLSLPAEELQQQIDSELAANPALEIVDERRCPVCKRLLPARGNCPTCSQPVNQNPDDPIVWVSPREDFYTGSGTASDDETLDDPFSSATEDLASYVLRQIAPDLNIEDRKIAAFMVTHLDEDGLLTVKLEEIAFYFHVPVARIENIQRSIQRADPLGVGSRTPQEALLVQLDILAETHAVPELARRIIQEGMDYLSRRQYNDLSRALKVPMRLVKPAVKFITENLNPFPGRSHWGDFRQPTSDSVQVYQRPDIIVGYQNEDVNKPLLVEIIMPICGTLRVNPLFKEAIRQAPDEKRDEWRNYAERASLFIKCIQQRNNTMQRLLFRIVSLQKEFILRGEKYLKPVTRAQLSRELEVHESTISRAVSGKTVQLPNKRIVPLSEFFDRSLNVRTIIRDFIVTESHPLSDMELVELLKKQGIGVARRTVAKYRAMEGILPAHLRHYPVKL